MIKKYTLFQNAGNLVIVPSSWQLAHKVKVLLNSTFAVEAKSIQKKKNVATLLE